MLPGKGAGQVFGKIGVLWAVLLVGIVRPQEKIQPHAERLLPIDKIADGISGDIGRDIGGRQFWEIIVQVAKRLLKFSVQAGKIPI